MRTPPRIMAGIEEALRPNYSAILAQENESCELGQISFCNRIEEARAIKAECQRKTMKFRMDYLDAKNHTNITPMRKIEYKALSCFEIFADYEIILIQHKDIKPIENASEFFKHLEHLESVLIIDDSSTPEEQLFLHKMRVFLLALKLHTRIITQEPKKFVMDAFFHFACEMQNYKNRAESIFREIDPEEKEKNYLLGLISDATQLFENSKQLRYRNYWCFVTMALLSAAIRHINEIDVKNYERFELGFIKHFSQNLSIPRDIIPKKNSPNTQDNFQKLVTQEIIKILLSPKENRFFRFEKEGFILAQLIFIRLQLLGIYQNEKSPSKKEKLKKDLLCIHDSLCKTLPWLILYQHFLPSPALKCLSIQAAPDFDAILGLKLSEEQKAESNPLPFLQQLSQIFLEESKMRQYLKKAKAEQIPFQAQPSFPVLARFFIFCEKAKQLNKAPLISLVKSALHLEVLSIEEAMKTLESSKSSTQGPKKGRPKNKSAKKKKAKKTQKKVSVISPETQEPSPSPSPIEAAEISVSPEPSSPTLDSEAPHPFNVQIPLEDADRSPNTESPISEISNTDSTRLAVEVDRPKPPRIGLSEYLFKELNLRREIMLTSLQLKCHPVHQLIQILNAEADSDNHFKFATFLSGGALLFYFLGYKTLINDYDLRCHACLPEIEAQLKTIQKHHEELGIATIAYHGIHTQHPLLRLSFSKYPGLLVEFSSMAGSPEGKPLLECVQLAQEQQSDFIPNSLFYTESSGKEFLLDFQGAIQALYTRPRLLSRTPFEHPPENKVLIILRGLKFLAKYPDFWPSVDLIGWIQKNKTCFEETACFQASAHAFFKLIYSGLTLPIFHLMLRFNLIDLLHILCPPLYRHMLSVRGLWETLNNAQIIDSNLSAGFKERESLKGQYWSVLHDALSSLLYPVHDKINVEHLPKQIELIRKKEEINWSGFWKPIDPSQTPGDARTAPRLLN